MTDTATKERITIRGEGGGERDVPYIAVPASQLDALTSALFRAGIRNWVATPQVALDGGPYLAFVNLYPGQDLRAAQRALDELR